MENILDNKIKQFCKESRYLSFRIGEYQIPKLHKNQDIELHRNKLISSESSFEASFRYDIEILQHKKKKPYYNFHKEFPVVISNRELWKSLLEFCGETGEEFKERNYFVLDFIFPLSGIIVEIDSDYHKGKEKYDKARDLYLAKFGLTTIRYYEYGKSAEERKRHKIEIDKILTYHYNQRLRSTDSPIQIDQIDAIHNDYFKTNRKALILIGKIINHLGEPKFLETSKIELTVKIIKSLYPEVKRYTQEDLDLFFNVAVKTQLWDLFKKEAVLKP